MSPNRSPATKDEKAPSTLRLHPLFPTVEEVKNGTPFLSDHLPQLIKSPKLNIVTWNIHAPDAATSGFSAEEKEKDIIERGNRIIDAIIKIINNQKNLDIILLQEVFLLGPLFNDRLKKELASKDWSFIEPPQDGARNLLTLFDKNKVTVKNLSETTVGKLRYNGIERIINSLSTYQQEIFKHQTHAMAVQKKYDSNTLFHVHWPQSGILSSLIKLLKILLDISGTIVAGDFNNRIPNNSNQELGIGNVVNQNLTQKNIQSVNFTDGGFCYKDFHELSDDYDDDYNSLCQLNTEILNPETGMKYQLLPINDLIPIEFHKYHPVISVDPLPFATFFAVQTRDITFIHCRNTLGKPGFGFSSEDMGLFNFIKETAIAGASPPVTIMKNKQGKRWAILADESNAAKFKEAITHYYHSIQKIETLLDTYKVNPSDSFKERRKEKESFLTELKQHIQNENENYTLTKNISLLTEKYPLATQGWFSQRTSTLLNEIKESCSQLQQRGNLPGK